MNDAIARQLIYVVGGLFAAAAAAIFTAKAVLPPGRGPACIWTVFFIEMAIVLSVVVPAYFGRWGLMAFASVVGPISTRELARVLQQAGARVPVMPLVAAACALPLAAAVLKTDAFYIVCGSTFLLVLLAERTRATLWVLLYPVLGAAHLVLLSLRPDGFGQIVYLYALLETNDAAAYLFGSFFGKRKIWPRLSPNKTVFGSVSGLISAIGVALLFHFTVPQFTVLRCILTGLFVGILGQAGDLVSSAFKRRAGVKDYSALVPTQGGALDVFDALLFVAPLYWAATSMLETDCATAVCAPSN